ncbi:MAG TPA: DUF305 domain-containing protein [Gemmatimonadaceae bacterium]|nr:DUF305 domain-containing protein [Gemmatimonadaceae bacterium]
MPRKVSLRLAPAAWLPLVVACGGVARGTPAVDGGLAPIRAPAPDSIGLARARADSAFRPWTAADVAFLRGMIGHHAQAIRISSWAASHGASPSVLTLAERIASGQRDEIAIMQQWLVDRRQHAPEPFAGSEHEHHDMMPGMLTEEQLATLDAARAGEFDRLFLTFMIQHHQGAVAMVRELLAVPGASQDQAIFRIARDVEVDQTTEIARMQRMLAALPGL